MLNNRVVDMNGRILFLFFTYIFQGVANMEFHLNRMTSLEN